MQIPSFVCLCVPVCASVCVCRIIAGVLWIMIAGTQVCVDAAVNGAFCSVSAVVLCCCIKIILRVLVIRVAKNSSKKIK